MTAHPLWSALLEGAPDAISLVSLDGLILAVNRRWEEIMQAPRSSIEGHHIGEFTLEKSRTGVRRMLEEGMLVPSLRHLRRSDGAILFLEFTFSAVEVEPGQRVVLAIARDVGEQVRARAQLMLTDRLLSVGMLASGVAHEINNPLAAVLTNLELAGRQLSSMPQRTPVLEDLHEEIHDARIAVERVRQIVKDLKVFAREEEGKRGPVELRHVLESVLRMAKDEIRPRARVVKDYGEVPPVLGNDSRLGQVFFNLVVNAAQSFSEERVESNEIFVGLSAEEGWVVGEVRDNGCGMSRDVLDRLFTPFFTTKGPGAGTGLGLAICQRLVSEAGGQIQVESEIGRGTRVRVRLPPARVRRELPAAPSVRTEGRRPRVLVVDDEPMVVKSLQRVLEEEYEVTACTSACVALDLLRAGARFDLIVSDLIMPHIGGQQLHEELRQFAAEQAAKMIFLTGSSGRAGTRSFLESTGLLHIEKPVDGKVLKAIVQEQISRLA
jgi:PAS domain S-box-containing protein